MKNIKLIIVLLLGVAFFVSCDSQSGEGIFPDLDTYQSVVNAQNGIVSSKLFCSISSSSCTSPRMPKNDAPLSNNTITTIKNWIDTNYPEN